MAYTKCLTVLLAVYLCQSMCSAGDEDIERRKPMRYGKRDGPQTDHRPTPANALFARLLMNAFRRSMMADTGRVRVNGPQNDNPVIDYYD